MTNQTQAELTIDELRLISGCIVIAELQADILSKVFKDQVTDDALTRIKEKIDAQIRVLVVEGVK